MLDDGASSMACSIAEPEEEKEAPKSESDSETEMPIVWVKFMAKILSLELISCHITASLSPPLTCEISVLLLIANWTCYRRGKMLFIYIWPHSLAHDKTNAASHTLSVFSLCQSIDVDWSKACLRKINFSKKKVD